MVAPRLPDNLTTPTSTAYRLSFILISLTLRPKLSSRDPRNLYPLTETPKSRDWVLLEGTN